MREPAFRITREFDHRRRLHCVQFFCFARSSFSICAPIFAWLHYLKASINPGLRILPCLCSLFGIPSKASQIISKAITGLLRRELGKSLKCASTPHRFRPDRPFTPYDSEWRSRSWKAWKSLHQVESKGISTPDRMTLHNTVV